jgi:hypothetical protein
MHRVVLLGLFGVCACAQPSQTRAPANDEPVAAEPVLIAEPSPSLPSEAEVTPPGPSTDEPAPAVTGIPECDSYLALYKRCEEHLKPEIMAGNRRFHHSEEASLVHYAGTPEAASMPATCKGMLDQLQQDCPEQHRTP